MSGINKAIILGRLGKDPDTKHLPNGDTVCNFTIATSETWKDKSGEKQERTEWHRIVAFRKLGEICCKYLGKGKLVYVEGKIQTRTWDDKDGNKRYTTEIVASDMQMLGGKDSDGRQEQQAGGSVADSDDIPF
jgi:single-strand DNA-binding protein